VPAAATDTAGASSGKPPWGVIAGGVVALLVVAAVLFLLLSGGDDSGGSTDTTSADTTAGPTTTEDGTPTIGAPISLETFETTLSATVTGYHVSRGGRFDEVPAGTELVGIELSIENTGSEAYVDSPGNGAKLITTAGVPLKPFFPVGGDCSGSGFSSSANVPPGATREGCIAFKLRAGQEGGEFEWTPNSGFADDSGRWALPPVE